MKTRKCQWCSTPYEHPNPTKMFCAPKCKREQEAFMMAVGKRLAPIAMVWRGQRGRKGEGADALKEMCALLDKANADYAAKPTQPLVRHHRNLRSSGVGVSRWNDYERKPVDAEGDAPQ